MWSMIHVIHDPCDPRSMWSVIHVIHDPCDPRSMWSMIHVIHDPCDPRSMWSVIHMINLDVCVIHSWKSLYVIHDLCDPSIYRRLCDPSQNLCDRMIHHGIHDTWDLSNSPYDQILYKTLKWQWQVILFWYPWVHRISARFTIHYITNNCLQCLLEYKMHALYWIQCSICRGIWGGGAGNPPSGASQPTHPPKFSLPHPKKSQKFSKIHCLPPFTTNRVLIELRPYGILLDTITSASIEMFCYEQHSGLINL